MAGFLLLGPVLFDNFELPERISWGGSQRLKVHHIAGGERVIDAMGRDDATIVWSGIFSGDGASARARLVDLMRADTAVWPLTWDLFFYSVVVSEFRADFARSNWIPYRIGCTVLRDEAEGLVETTASLAASALGDLATAEGLGSGISLAGALTALGVAGATTQGTGAYGAAAGSVRGASGQLGAAMTGADQAVAGASVTSADGIVTATQAAGSLAALSAARGYVMRAQVNLGNAST